ncbi:hypothetical protein HYY70_00485 [Candidatus Woesearchaeota archaeon]|nr:hypothetical protein [Candidatus Woesearchaeota archaeon]
MEKTLFMKKLEKVDRELRSILTELKMEKPKSMTVSELNKLMEKDRILDIDSTKLIREMREKKYGL